MIKKQLNYCVEAEQVYKEKAENERSTASERVQDCIGAHKKVNCHHPALNCLCTWIRVIIYCDIKQQVTFIFQFYFIVGRGRVH